ncbi:MAG: metallophosphoesterase [Calditrichaeota bacterium]|nr:MAG: metallophosphoesterase [Calditrichota bacterium]
MRIAVLSDIHSNVFALEAVLIDMAKRSPDLVLNLGDILYGPIAPRATYDLLQQQDIINIRGNQDRQIYEASPAEIEINPTMQFILQDLDEAGVEWLKSLPFDKQMNGEIYLCHGSPGDDMDYLLENVEKGFPCLRSENEIITLLNNQSSKLILCGHTHVPRTVALESGQLIVNPGSVGLPAYSDDFPVKHSMENFSPHAAYAIIEKNKSGWTVQHMKIPYDHEKAAGCAKMRHRDDWAHFLTTGRGLRQPIIELYPRVQKKFG